MPTHFSCQIAVFSIQLFYVSPGTVGVSPSSQTGRGVEVPNFLPICHMNPRSRIVLSDPDVLLIGRSGARHAVDYARMRRFRSVFLFTISPARPAVSIRSGSALPPGACCSSPPPPALSGRDCGGGISSGRFFSFSPFWPFFLVLLVYTLFFALPFHDTYIHGTTAPSLCRSGVYALCRHPGVLWLSGVLSVPVRRPGDSDASGGVCCLYFVRHRVCRVSGPLVLPQTVPRIRRLPPIHPFLLPNVRSIRQCVRTWRGTGRRFA